MFLANAHRQMIKESMQMIMDDTSIDGVNCITFRARNLEDRTVLRFFYGTTCHASVKTLIIVLSFSREESSFE